MTAGVFLQAIAGLSGLVFIVSSMLSVGLCLTVPQIIQPLKNVRIVILALLANFVLVPLLAYAISLMIPLEESLRIGLLVLATAAGAPFIPKLVQGAKGNVPFGVGLMFLLMVVTIFYMPIILPLLLPGVAVNPWDIVRSLIVTMLSPLAIGLLIKSRSPGAAQHWAPVMNRISSLAILVLLVLGLGLNVANIIRLIGSGGIGALLLFIVGCLGMGLLFGGRDPGIRSAMGLGTAQRNLAAAILVASQNFPGTNTVTFVLVAAVLLLLILLPTARALGAHRQASASAAAPPESATPG